MFNRWSPGFRADQIRSRKRLEEEGLHEELEERFRKTLYYGELPEDKDCPSLPLTDVAVDFFQGATPRGLGQVNMSVASSLAENACMTPGSLVTSMIYAKRLRQRNPDYLRKMSSSDLFFISVMMASKYMYDEGVEEEVFNDEWAEAGSMELDEVNQMERDFLSAMDWQLFVSQSEFLKSVHDMEKRIAWTQGCDRGWLSYTDMDVMWDDLTLRKLWENIAKEWLKVVAVSSAAYIAGFLTMLGSTAMALQLSPALVGFVLPQQPIRTQPIQTQPRFDQPMESHLSDRQPIESQPHFGQPISVDSLEEQVMAAMNHHERLVNNRVEMPTNLPILPWNKTEDESPTKYPDSNVTLTLTQMKESKHDGPKNLLETVLPQLWAVVAFKDRFVQLICAFSEGLQHIASGENLRTLPKKCESCSRCCKKTSQSADKSDQSKACPQCQEAEARKRQKSCSLSAPNNDVFDSGANDLMRLKSILNFDPWCCHNNRPPDTRELNVGTLQFPDISRGFATSVAVAA